MALDFELSKEMMGLRARARETFAALSERQAGLRANERQRALRDDVWLALAEIGFHGFLVSGRFGGSERGLLASVLVMEELAAVGLQSFLPILGTMVAAGVGAFGSDELKEQILRPFVAGESKVAIASTEADAGFNVLNCQTSAEEHGDHFVVNGSKAYVSGADVADRALLVTRTMPLDECKNRGLPKTAGISLFVVDLTSDGIERTELPSRGEGVLTQFALELRDVRVPAGHLLGKENEGVKVMFRAFNPERALAGAMALGMSRYALDLARDRAGARKVFGDTPIGAYQSVQHPLAEVAIRAEAVRWTVYRAAWLFDEGRDAREVAVAANAAKYLGAELGIRAVDAAIETFGGKGFDEDYGLIHLWEQARLLKTAPISNTLILNQIAEHALGLPRSY